MGMMDIIDAIIQQESGGNPNLRNPKSGAMGLMQVMPDTARNPGFGVKPLADPWNATENRRFGTDYFRAMERRYPGDRDAALAAYNWGPGNADRWVQSGKTIPLPAETQNYIRSINAMTGGGQAAPARGAPPMQDPFNDFWRRRQEAAQGITSIERMPPPGEMPPAPMQPPPTARNMSIGGRGGTQGSFSDNIPQAFGGSDRQGYFGRLFEDPMFLMGASVLGAGLSGRDAGSALMGGAQAASAMSEMTEKRRRAAAWDKLFTGGEGNMTSPYLKRLPPELVPIIRQMGPEAGMQVLMKTMFQPKKYIPTRDGIYDADTGKWITNPNKGDVQPGAGTLAQGERWRMRGGQLDLDDSGRPIAEPIPGSSKETVSAETAARVGLGEAFERKVPELERRIKADELGTTFGFKTDGGLSLDYMFGRGKAGDIYRQLQEGADALLRNLTGAGMSKEEATAYAERYLPSYTDSNDTVVKKLQGLDQALRAVRERVQTGRGRAGVDIPQGAPAPGTANDDPLGLFE